TQRGGEWVLLGEFPLQAGDQTVTLTDNANGTVIADAIRLEGPPHIIPGTEYSTIDTVIGLLPTLLASQALGLPTAALEQAFRNVNWAAVTLPGGVISHGFTDAG